MLCCRADRIDDRIVYADDEVTTNDVIVNDVITTPQGYPNDYSGNKEDFAELYTWARTQCVPVVREITFENGEVSSADVAI